MTLRIENDIDETIRLEGRFTVRELPELDRALEGCDPRRLRVDVSDLRSADPEGIAALARLRDAGAELVGASPYVRLLLGEAVD